ncbi:MAG: hypothetical protein F6K16_29785 [Symploca sp. SIO2B6]|nr:hypothetical protein [Symploca sp. SIO2B6]
MNQLVVLGITITLFVSVGILSMTSTIYAEFQPPDNGGPETTQGSGTRWSL